MNFYQTKYELQNILSGKSSTSQDPIIQTICSYLRRSKRASPLAEEKHKFKSEEAARIISFAIEFDLIVSDIDESDFISSGAEQKVYLKNEKQVIKLNDAIYYASWEDYFYSLILHNYFFSDTAYDLIGFYLAKETLFAVVQQSFIKSDEPTNLNLVKSFLSDNGFFNIKNHDYRNNELGIILEDLHDENVLTNNGLLYFIDTVLFIEPDIFWQ